MPLVTTSVSNQ